VTDSTQSNGCSSFDGLRPSPRRHNPAKMPDYKQMLKEAEEREAGVKKVFQQYDVDGGGSIDPGEITCVMEDLGLLSGLKTDVTAFVAAAFARYDENDDGALSFEVHPPDSSASICPAHRQRTQSSDRTRTLTVFAVVAQEFKKFYNAAKDDAQGRKPPAPAATKGRDSKGLDSSTNDARQRLKEEKARKKAEEAEKIRAAPAAWLK
jgi:hypothetical protein